MKINFYEVPFTANNRRMLRYTYKHLRLRGMKRKTARREVKAIYMVWLRSIAWYGAERDPNSEHYIAPETYRDPFCHGEGRCTNPDHEGLVCQS